MSKHDDPTTRCGCGAETGERRTCESCLNLLSKHLGDMSWLDEQLTASISRQRGAGLTGGASSGETALPWNEWASKTERRLRVTLVRWVHRCADAGVPNSSPRAGLPRGEESSWTITAMSRWLMWRVDGLARFDFGHDAFSEIRTVAEAALRCVTWKRDSRVYLGACGEESCDGDVYAGEDDDQGRCDSCGHEYDVDVRRAAMEHELDERLYTAEEFAHLSTFLGLDIPRERVRKRVNLWHHRKRITPRAHDDDGNPRFQYGEVRALLYSESATRKGA